LEERERETVSERMKGKTEERVNKWGEMGKGPKG